ncbi:hypothetical protein CN918_27100 [Priestia megaterium]|nr:hypothetical protein CN918_27100 [Priestia megaterium]
MEKAFHFFGTLFRLFTRTLINFFILAIVGGATGLLTFQFVNDFTDSSYGVNNIVVLITAFVFFPLLTSLYVIFLISESRKRKKKLKTRKKRNLEVAE